MWWALISTGTRGSRSHSASLPSLVTLLCVVELLSLNCDVPALSLSEVSPLLVGGGGGKSFSLVGGDPPL